MTLQSDVRRLTLKAPAKINLALDILHKRSDGYHEVQMVMQAVSLADTLHFSEQRQGVSVCTNIPALRSDESNLAYRAAVRLMEVCRYQRGIRIDLEKQIPMGAGLGGGSADAAGVLIGLNRFWSLGLSRGQLADIGASIGSDVPFCLYGGTMLAEGRGEKLSPLPLMPQAYVVLAKPAVSASTAWVYRQYRAERVAVHPDILGMHNALLHRNLQEIAGHLANVLETVTIPAFPIIDKIKAKMIESGAEAALMSGSGTTVFGLTGDPQAAERIAAAVQEEFHVWTQVAETVGIREEEDGTSVIAN